MKIYPNEPRERLNIRFGCGESFWMEHDDIGICDGDGDGLCENCEKRLEEFDEKSEVQDGN